MAMPRADEYRPYHTMPAFGEGYEAYQSLQYRNPYDGRWQDGVKAQAWDRGLEFASRVERFLREQTFEIETAGSICDGVVTVY